MNLSFVISTDPQGLTNVDSKRRIRQHASREMWKARKRDQAKDAAAETPTPNIGRARQSAAASRAAQHIIYPCGVRRPRTRTTADVGLTPREAKYDGLDSRVSRTILSRRPSPRNDPVSILRASCLDPFFRYPIEMKPLEQRIVHHGQSARRIPPILLDQVDF